MPILREQTKNYLDKFRYKTGFYNLVLNPEVYNKDTEINYVFNPVKVTTPPQGTGTGTGTEISYLRVKSPPQKASYLRIKEPEIFCSGAPNVASVWITYRYSSGLLPKLVLEIDNDKYISDGDYIPTHLFLEKYPHMQVMASSGGEYYFSNTSPTLSHRITMYELIYDADFGSYGDTKIQLTNNNTVISFCLGESKGL